MTKTSTLIAAVMVALMGTSNLTTMAQSRPQIPVIIEAADPTSCGIGVVFDLNPHGDGFLAVKAGPGLDYTRIDKLYNGEQVIVCAYAGEWIGIVYSRVQQDCNALTPWPRTLPYTGPCRSGWVHRRWVAPVAG